MVEEYLTVILRRESLCSDSDSVSIANDGFILYNIIHKRRRN